MQGAGSVQQPACVFFMQGRCQKGSACTFSHDAELAGGGGNGTGGVELTTPGSSSSDSQDVSRGPACHFFKQGKCQKGSACRFSHDVELAGGEAGAGGLAQDCDVRTAETGQGGLSPDTQEDDTVDTTITLVLDGLRCKLGPGLNVEELTPDEAAPDTNAKRIIITGLTSTVADQGLELILSSFGKVKVQRKHESYAFATFTHVEAATLAAKELNLITEGQLVRRINELGKTDEPPPPPHDCFVGAGKEGKAAEGKERRKEKPCKFGADCSRVDCHFTHPQKVQLEHRITFAIAPSRGPIVTNNVTVKVQWYSSSRTAWAQFNKHGTASQFAAKCNGKQLRGKTITTKFQTPKPNQRSSFSVALYGVYAEATDGSVTNFVNKFAVPSSVSLAQAPFNNRLAGGIVERLLQEVGPLTSFGDGGNADGSVKRKALARFADADCADKACEQLHDKPVKELGGGKLFVQRLFAAKFILPNAVYQVLQPQLDSSIASFKDTFELRCSVFPSASTTTISIQADKSAAIVRAKIVLSPLIQGVQVKEEDDSTTPLWHDDFALKESAEAFLKINETLGGLAYLLTDLRRRELRLWGEAAACQRAAVKARQMNAAMLCKSHTLPVSKATFKAVLRHGLLEKIVQTCGAVVSLDIRSQSLVVNGDTDMVKHVLAFLAQAESEDQGVLGVADPAIAVCNVCYCEVENDFEFACGHHYCLACAQTWFSAIGTPGAALSFPLVCLEQSCEHRVAITDFKRALEKKHFQRVARTAVDEFVNSHLERFQYCINPGCSGILSTGVTRTAVCCLCRTSVCTSCSVEEHEGLTCRQYLEAKAPPDKLRQRVVEEILTLRCPHCSQAFIDFNGCFALQCCKCPCGFCGWCLQDCGKDAHDHVRTCTAKPKGADMFFGTVQQFESTQKQRQARQLRDFFAALHPEERAKLTESMAVDLRDLDLAHLLPR